MKFSHAALLIATSTLVAGPAFAAKKKSSEPPCVKGKVLSAFQMRMLQTELVVGALSCKLTPRYNDFVIAYRPDLMSAHRSLMGYFARESRLEDYKSRTANEVSQRSLANITEFGATPLFTVEQLRSAGVAMVLYPLSAFRAMNKAALNIYETIRRDGSQQAVVDTMQTRMELYDVIGYHAYEQHLDALFARKK